MTEEYIQKKGYKVVPKGDIKGAASNPESYYWYMAGKLDAYIEALEKDQLNSAYLYVSMKKMGRLGNKFLDQIDLDRIIYVGYIEFARVGKRALIIFITKSKKDIEEFKSIMKTQDTMTFFSELDQLVRCNRFGC